MPSVWLAGPAEADTVAGLLVEFRDWYGAREPSRRSFQRSVQRIMEEEGGEFLLGATGQGAAAAGVCQLRFRHSVWMDTQDCWLEDLFVREPARRAGLGAALLETALGRARERGCRRVELDTSESNQGALRLYRRFGFSEYSKSAPPARDLFLGLYFEPRR
jgi:ribosomal protein S18 acetylase RimI-like enzyme